MLVQLTKIKNVHVAHWDAVKDGNHPFCTAVYRDDSGFHMCNKDAVMTVERGPGSVSLCASHKPKKEEDFEKSEQLVAFVPTMQVQVR